MARASTPDGEGASFLTALFTATSATCVTGLVVVDTGAAFSRFGQWIILVLIQLGGLGIMTITSALAVLLRVRLSAGVRSAMLELLDEATVTGFRRLVVSATAVTLAFELAGAAALYPSLTHGPDGAPLSTGDRVFFAAFHAISAFCNAGFSLYPDSLARFAGDVPVNFTVMGLVLAGGIGFPVVVELLRPRTWLRRPGAAGGLSVHARLALTTSGLLVVAGTVGFLVFEWGGALGGLSPLERVLAALFQSVSFRTAGFSTVAFSHLHPATMLVGMALMFIGGSPLSTAGGIKTTTLAVLALALRALLRGRPDVEAHHRRLPAITIYRAVAVALISGGLLLAGTVALTAFERRDAWGELLFEAVSAFGTVGLSTGVTPTLGVVGRLVLVVLMFVGRLGPFTMALTVSTTERGHFEYPTGKVLIG